MEVTPEMRAAVYADDCLVEGHIISIENLMSNNPNIRPTEYTPEIRSENEGELPHIFCRRCKKVWILVDEPAEDYEAAEAAFVTKLKATDDYTKRVKGLKEKRAERKDRGHGHVH